MGWRRRLIRRSSRPFTLLELMICFALLAIAASAVIIKARPVIEHYRFEASAKKFVQELNLTRHLSASCRSDMEFNIRQDGSKLLCIRRKDEPVKFGLHFDKTIKIDHIPYISFNGKNVEDLTIFFTGTGWVQTEGIIHFYSNKDLKKAEIYSVELKQAPHFIITQHP